jgi:TonB-dependent starch-binding outer membrane protein SusC
MNLRLLARRLKYAAILLIMPFLVNAQQKTVTGKVTSDKDGSAISGATVLAKGSTKGTQTAADGAFVLEVPAATKTLVVSAVGSVTEQVTIGADNTANVSLKVGNEGLTEVVVIGYGTARKKDLTGSVGSVSSKDFNKGLSTSPENLIQGKIAGVQVINNSGAPGGATTFKIRGNSSIRAGNQPLFVIDGVIVDGSSARPGLDNGAIGRTPDANPLAFLNPNDIASIDVLKDASATAIYGSRGANGVVIVTTKKGKSGATQIEFTSSIGISSIAKKVRILTTDEYKQELAAYPSVTGGDLGGSADGYGAILRSGTINNHGISISGGGENARMRFSTNYLDQQGILKGTGLKKIVANLSSNFKLLESKKLGLDFNITVGNTKEDIGAISDNAGFTGNLLSTAIQWNPTNNLRNPDGSIKQYVGSSTINPLELLEGYSDKANVTSILGSIAPSYKITNELEYKLVYGFNYGIGERRSSIQQWVNIENFGRGDGWAGIGNNKLLTQQVTQTLSYNKQVTSKVNLNALLGYEYLNKTFSGSNLSGKKFSTAAVDYTDIIQFADNGTKRFSSFNDPNVTLRSYFTRVALNISDKYLLTATMRRDGSTKFGANNRFGYFPSFAAAWNISKENFFQVDFINSLKLRGGYGVTGNQEFPAGASQKRIVYGENGGISQNQLPNVDLKWQQDVQANIGLDFTVMKNRISGSVEYFNKTTKNLLFPLESPVPSPGTTIWTNLAGNVQNKGFEVSLNGTIVKKEDFTWDLGFNASFTKNKVTGLPAPILTGELNGQGMSGTFVQLITNDQPLNVFYTREYMGIDANGQSKYADGGNSFSFQGNPNPTTLLGITTSLGYKKLTVTANMNGAMGHKLYNNTANSVLPIGNLGSRNIAYSIFKNGEAFSNPVTSSARYLEKGNYLKMANLTASYNFGSIVKGIRNVNLYVTGQNLFVITKYTGFDPEVNTNKQTNGVPSVGIDYIGYPSARTFTFGLNLSL